MTIKRYSPETLQELRSLVNPVDLLTGTGGVSLSDIMVGHDEIRCPCPLHGGDNKSAFSWRKSTGTWTCFSQNCGNNLPRDVFNFVSLKLGISFAEAILYVAQQCGFDLPNEENIENKQIYELCRDAVRDVNLAKKYRIENLKELSYLPGYTKEGFDTIVSYLETRGYDYDDLKLFKLYPSKDSFKLLRLGIPVFDEKGKLVGINARLMDTIMEYPTEIKGDDGKVYPINKYRLSKYNKGSILYNLNNAKEHSVENGMIIVEGQFDVMRLHTYGYKNAVCTMGTILTPQQISLLYKHCFHAIFLVEEGSAAEKGVMKSISKMKFGMKISVAMLPSGDADSNSKDVIDYTLKNAVRLSNNQIKDIIKEVNSGLQSK